MAGVPVKFRCYRCNTLLGVSRAKIGSVIACVKCGTELVVPDPDEAPVSEASVSAAVSTPSGLAEPTLENAPARDAGIPLALQDIRPEDIRIEPEVPWNPSVPSSAPAEPTIGPLQTEFEAVTGTGTGIEIEIEIETEPRSAPAAPDPVFAARIVPPPEPSRPVAEPEPIVPKIEVEPVRIVRERSRPGRPRDLTIPRSVVAFWSLFVLIAQALGFVAGLLAGHYLWRVH
jgi:hypothetical protein